MKEITLRVFFHKIDETLINMSNITSILLSSPILLGVFILLIGAYFYKLVTGKLPPHRSDISKHRELGEQKGFWYQLWLVFITPIMFIYNLIVDAIWFVTEIFHFVIKLLVIVYGWIKWIWSELVWPGLSFIFGIAKWYLWTWPWTYIHLSFNSLPKVASFPYFIAGFTGLALSYSLIHLGAFIDHVLSLNTPIVTLIFCSLATSLIALGSGLVTSMLRANITKGNWKTVKDHLPNGIKALRFVLVYAILGCILVSVEYLIWRSGWFHQWGNVIGGILSGPAVGFAVLSVLNFIIISFATVFAGSFVLDNNEMSKDSFRPFILLSIRNIGSVIFSSPIASFNAIILSVIPVLLMFGALKLSSGIASFAGSSAMNSTLNASQELAWVDSTSYKAVADSLFEKYLEDLKEKRELDYSISRRESWGIQVQKFLATDAKPYEFDAPRGLKSYSTEKEAIENNLRNVAKNWKMEDSTSRLEIQMLESKLQENEAERNVIVGYQNRFNQALVDSLMMVQWQTDTLIDPSFRYWTSEDFELAVQEISGEIDEDKREVDFNKKGLERIQKMSALEAEVLENESSQISTSRIVETIAYFFMGLFIALIWAFAFGFIIPAFNSVWYSIYMKDKDEADTKIYVVELWKTMKSSNSSQPLMSLFFWVFVIGGVFFLDRILSLLTFLH